MTEPTPALALLHEIELRTRWADMDALGHVNNAVYFTYLEQVRVDWLAALGPATTLDREGDSGPVVVTAACSFLIPVVHPARLLVRMYGAAPGRSSFETRYEIRDAAAPDTLYTTGTARVVWVSAVSGRSTALPDAVRRRLPPADSSP